MRTTGTFRRFLTKREKIHDLATNNPRFKRVYSEYRTLSREIRSLENTPEKVSVSDDFIAALELQYRMLEEEIGGWLRSEQLQTAT